MTPILVSSVLYTANHDYSEETRWLKCIDYGTFYTAGYERARAMMKVFERQFSLNEESEARQRRRNMRYDSIDEGNRLKCIQVFKEHCLS